MVLLERPRGDDDDQSYPYRQFVRSVALTPGAYQHCFVARS
jgi:hypothetical protein